MFTPATAARLLGLGALGVAVTTAAEVVTAPYSPAVSLYQLNPAVHAAKVVAALVFVVGVLGVLGHHRARLGRVGTVAGVALAAATLAGAVPYSVVEASLSPSLSPAEANARLDATYAEQAWLGIVASIAMPVVVLGILTLGVVALRRRLLPRWIPVASLAAVPLGIVVTVLGEVTGTAVPHPPVWVFLGLAAYGIGFAPARSTVGDPVGAAHQA